MLTLTAKKDIRHFDFFFFFEDGAPKVLIFVSALGTARSAAQNIPLIINLTELGSAKSFRCPREVEKVLPPHLFVHVHATTSVISGSR